MSSENRAISIGFPKGPATANERVSVPGISPTASFRCFVISDVPILLSSDGSRIIFKELFSELCIVPGAHWSTALVFPIDFSMPMNNDFPSLNSLLN